MAFQAVAGSNINNSSWQLLGIKRAGSMQTTAWRKVATATDATKTVSVPLNGAYKADVTLLAYEGAPTSTTRSTPGRDRPKRRHARITPHHRCPPRSMVR